MGKANFLEPGADGKLSSNYAEWQFGVTYRVRPEIQSPLNRGREYRILTSVRRKVGRERKFKGRVGLSRGKMAFRVTGAIDPENA